jgi:hypothetical protein
MSMLVQGVWGTPLPSDIQSTLLISRTVRWEDVPKIDDRPVAFVAAGSHGVWSTPGHHVYADVSQPLVSFYVHSAHKQLLNVIKLIDETDDKGPIWDTKSHVIPIQWWHSPSNGSRIQHSGPLAWMNFRGRWGNLGDRGWLNKILPASYVVDAPTGPNRDFRGAMDVSSISIHGLPLMISALSDK